MHETNHAAISRYRKSGYREFGRRVGYYEDGGDALRFEKRLVPDPNLLATAPPYFHQTVEFTCGPACIMMALAWADQSFQPEPACEFRLWRESTTIFMSAGPGGCEPYGMAVTLKRHGHLKAQPEPLGRCPIVHIEGVPIRCPRERRSEAGDDPCRASA